MDQLKNNPLWDSSLSMEERLQYLVDEMTLEEKFSFLATSHPALERLGIPSFSFGGEAAHGVEARHDQGNVQEPEHTTSFTQPIGMSASWDQELIEQAGAVVGTEARALYNRHPGGGLSRWAPTVDMERDPRWGRNEEGYGEDPLLNGKMASAYVRGLQGRDEKFLRMAASLKHFYANNVEQGRVWKSSSVDPRNKQEYYLEPFRRCVEEGGAEAMMTAYNEINGVPAILNHEVQDVVKKQWGLKGHIVCDGGDMTQTVDFHHYYETHAETVAEGLKAGIDCFTDYGPYVEQAAREAYQKHLITEEDIDRALRNSFGTMIRLGLFDKNGENPYAKIGEDDINTQEAAILSRKMAQKSAVLLKNENHFLPLSKADDVALIGPVGDAWYQDWYGGEPPYRVTLKAGVENLLGRQVDFENGLSHIILKTGESYVGLSEDGQVILVADRAQALELEVNDWGFGNWNLFATAVQKFVSLRDDGQLLADKKAAFGWFVKENFRLEQEADGLHIYGWNGCKVMIGGVEAFEAECIRDGLVCAKELAKKAKKVIVALGCNPVINAKEEIDRTDIILPPAQEKLVQEIYAVNPNVVLMLFTNYPYAINWEQERLPAILQMATGSQEMGNAAADLLFGQVSPAGKLPQTWYRSVDDLPDMDDYDIIKGKRTYRYFDREVLYPFGHGLSYADFSYEDFYVEKKENCLAVSLTVKNCGGAISDCVVQIYASRLSDSRIAHPKKQLIGFMRLHDLAAGEARRAELEISCQELFVYDVIGRKKIVEAGEYLIFAGADSCDDARAFCRIWVDGETAGVRNPRQMTPADHYDDYENIVLKHAGGGTSSAAAQDAAGKAKLVYRDFAFSGDEKQLVLVAKSPQSGGVRVTDGCGSVLGCWSGQLADFAKVWIPVELCGEAACGTLMLELEGDVEIAGFFFCGDGKKKDQRFSEKITKMPYGGDYNPEQWPEEIWKEDMRLFKLAGIDCVTLNVFSWASLQPSENCYNFEKLDEIMEMVRSNGLKVILATSTGAHPAWMAKKYPEITRTNFGGMKRKFGDRHNSCPNSPVYRKYAARLAGKLAERYKAYDNIIAWHISNEFGGECYCENCAKAFRVRLKDKYQTMEALNRAWNTAFWGHTFYDWDEVVPPNLLSEHFAENRTTFQGISLDYRRFNSDSMLEAYKLEYEQVKAVTPDIPVTTNLMGFYKPLDYQKWAKYLDFASWDNYPANEAPSYVAAMNHDLMRGIRQGQPFVLMEQTPSVTNWLSYNALKRPGVMRLWSWQAVAHGSDSVLFFQMRRSIGACEKYHGAVIDHAGHEHTRVFRELRALGKELKQIGDATLGSRTPAKVAIVVDWDNWWALEYSAGPSCDLRYLDEVQRYYEAFYEQNIPVDIVSVEDSLESYSLVVAPVLYMVKSGYAQKLEQFVKNGGCFVTTFFSGIVDEHDLVQGAYPGKLRDLLGIWVEEIDALPQGAKNSFTWNGKSYDCELLCDILYTEGAVPQCFYEKDFYADAPALTKNRYGAGSAWYVATRGERQFYLDFAAKLAQEAGVKPVWGKIPDVEICERDNESGRYLFFLNHGDEAAELVMEQAGTVLQDGRALAAGERVSLAAKDVMVLKI